MLTRIKLGICLGFAALAVFAAIGLFASETTVGAQIASGADLFQNNCARCHGADGSGGKGPNLTSEKKQAKWRASEEKLVNKITKGGLFMPSFGKKLKADEIKAIAAHVRTLKQ